jgi:hypothetical protein
VRRVRRQLGWREVPGPEFDELLADEDRRFPVIDFRKPVGVDAEPDRDAQTGEPVVLLLRVRVGLEDRAAIADDADRDAGREPVGDGNRNRVLAQVPARDVEPDVLVVDALHQNVGDVGVRREEHLIGRGGAGGVSRSGNRDHQRHDGESNGEAPCQTQAKYPDDVRRVESVRHDE